MESKEMTSVYRGSVIDSLERLFTSGTATALDDTQLLERFITCGDSTAFDAMLERHGPMVFRACRRMLNDPNDLDDAFQATFKGTDSTALVVLYSIGNDHDPAGKSGLVHLIEHVYVTAAAGETKARTVEEFGRRYADGANGQTGDRYTVFAAVFPKNDLELELKDAAARMGDLRLSADDLARERPRLLSEVGNMFGDFPMLAALNNARELVRPTAGGGRCGGLPAQVNSCTTDELQSFWNRY
jgi:hypothetical protein